MKRLKLTLISTVLFFYAHLSPAQTIDTLVDVGGYKLHFTILKGTGTPILFEAGGGNDGTIWQSILQPIARITGTTLITYDREGFGQSEVNKTESNDENHGIKNGVEALETALSKLGYAKNIMFVAHSYGNFYATLYSARHPDLVKSVVYIDANHANCISDEYIKTYFKPAEIAKLKPANLGPYYLSLNYARTIAMMRPIVLPSAIPTLDLVSDLPFLPDSTFQLTWQACHAQFNRAHLNNQSITAWGCGHYIFLENPPLAIHAIVNGYCHTLNQAQRSEVLKRNLDYSLEIANQAKKQEMDYRHSEEEFNAWANLLMRQNQLPKALAVFKLNTVLYPSSWKVYDSYGEALLTNGQNEEALKMYQKSIELNPDNEHGKTVVKTMVK